MLVKNFMTRHPVMVEPEASIVEAQAIMAETNVRHLPVSKRGKKLEGLISRQCFLIPPSDLISLNVWEIARFLSNMKVKNVMVKEKDVITIGPDEPLEAASILMAKNKIGCLPVIEEGVIVGIITEVDMMVELTRLLGGNTAGVRATVRVPDRIGEYAKIAAEIAKNGWGIYASGSILDPKDPEYWLIVFKVREATLGELEAALKGIEGQELLDIREMQAM